jgi:hypothetical protein
MKFHFGREETLIVQTDLLVFVGSHDGQHTIEIFEDGVRFVVIIEFPKILDAVHIDGSEVVLAIRVIVWSEVIELSDRGEDVFSVRTIGYASGENHFAK